MQTTSLPKPMKGKGMDKVEKGLVRFTSQIMTNNSSTHRIIQYFSKQNHRHMYRSNFVKRLTKGKNTTTILVKRIANLGSRILFEHTEHSNLSRDGLARPGGRPE